MNEAAIIFINSDDWVKELSLLKGAAAAILKSVLLRTELAKVTRDVMASYTKN